MKFSRRSFLTVLVAFALPLVIGGCKNDLTSPADSLVNARALWAATGPKTYTMTYVTSCECGPDITDPVVVRVKNGVVESRRYVKTGEALQGYDYWFPTVDQLFDKIEDRLVTDPTQVHVEYDDEKGYPVRVGVPGIAQEEVSYVSILGG
jgi:hypothetical protein